MPTDVRILFIGDEGVGKSSLITSLIREKFVADVPLVVPEVTVPPEVTPEKVTTHIVDTSSAIGDREALKDDIRRANVLCVVYAVDNRETFSRVTSYWLPLIRELECEVPVVLVGNKIDTRGTNVTNRLLEEDITPVMNEFIEVETCVECSAKALLNISEVFYFAQKAVLHPTAPLYDHVLRVLKPKCTVAMRRIFALCDLDKDGLLLDRELNEFQRLCFNTPLQQSELDGVKEVVRDHEPNGVVNDGLTESGFLFLHQLFIQRGRLETTWAVLRRFGYGDDLELREDFLRPELEVPQHCTVELSPAGYEFFAKLFKTFDADKDGALSHNELEALFATAPELPWDTSDMAEPETVVNQHGWITLQGFLARWSMLTLLDHQFVLSYIAYLGYFPDPTTSALRVTRGKKKDIKKKKSTRSVLQCYVFGATGSGKTSMLRSLIEHSPLTKHIATTKVLQAVNSVSCNGAEKYLVMREFPTNMDSEVIQNRRRLEECDVACFLYDSSDPNSFSYAVKLQAKFDEAGISCAFVATKSDASPVTQEHDITPEDYCQELELPLLRMSAKTGDGASEVFSSLVSLGLQPHLSVRGDDTGVGLSLATKVLKMGSALAVVGLAGYLVYRVVKQRT